MSEFITINSDILGHLWLVEPEYVTVLLALIDRENRDVQIGLTLNELARTVNVHPRKVHFILDQFHLTQWITLEKKTKHHVIKIHTRWTGREKSVPIPFTFDDTDETRLATVEQELQKKTRVRRKHSELSTIFKGEESDLYREIEANRGYCLDEVESNLLGKMIQKFGVERVKLTYRQMQSQKNPIRAAYAALQRGIKGQGAKMVESQPFQKVQYREYHEEGEST